MKTPEFWYIHNRPLYAVLLLPLSLAWICGGWMKALLTRRRTSRLRVVCIGNITAGGTGKTPMVAELAKAAKSRGFEPVVLTRGHGGTMRGPAVVDRKMPVQETGDEARMLSRTVPVVIAADKAAGAVYIEEHGLGDLIIMDDGMQSRRLAKDSQVAVFNGRRGLGNGLVIPAGPLRETLGRLRRADAIVITGEDRVGLVRILRWSFPDVPVFRAGRRLRARDLGALAGQRVVAFAGIGDPEGFFGMLEEAKVDLVERVPLADHDPLPESRLESLRALARQHGALLATTEKDAARLPRGSKDDDAPIQVVRLETHLDKEFIEHVLPAGGGKG